MNLRLTTIVGGLSLVIILGSAATALGELDPILPATHGYVHEQIALAMAQSAASNSLISSKLNDISVSITSLQLNVLNGDLRYLEGQQEMIKTHLEKSPDDMLLLQQQAEVQRQIDGLNAKLRDLQR